MKGKENEERMIFFFFRSCNDVEYTHLNFNRGECYFHIALDYLCSLVSCG